MGNIKQPGVYKIINILNDDFYIGSSVDIPNRWKQHRASFQKEIHPTRSILHAAVRKYGIDNFTFEIIVETDSDKESILAAEQFYLDLYEPVYNILSKAGSRLGSKHSPETLLKLKGRIHTPEWIAMMSAFMSEYMTRDEIRLKYSKLRKGRTFDEIFGVERANEIRAKIAYSHITNPRKFTAWNKGLPILPHVMEALQGGRSRYQAEHGAWNKGLPPLNHVIEALNEGRSRYHQEYGAWNKGKEILPHVREALFAGSARYVIENGGGWNKGRPIDPEHQRKMTEAARLANLGTTHSEETRRRISEATKGRPGVRNGLVWTDEERIKISEGIRSSDSFKESVKRRLGKVRKDNTSGYYGIIWTKDRWMVRVNKKYCGRFKTIEEAVARRDEVLASL